MTLRVRSLHLLPLLVAAGCAGPQEPLRPGAERPETVTTSINLSGFPPEFRRGFSDGCAAARANDPSSRPKSQGPYVVGWSDGFDYCRPKK